MFILHDLSGNRNCQLIFYVLLATILNFIKGSNYFLKFLFSSFPFLLLFSNQLVQLLLVHCQINCGLF